MKKHETITSTVGKNLPYLISSLNMTNKTAAEKIGISYNTLSNIINGRFLPSEETLQKIKLFVKSYGIDVSLLYKNEKPVCNFRLRISSGLSGNEKSALRATVQKIERLLNLFDTFKYNKIYQQLHLYEYFDVYTLPYKDQLFYPSQRLSQFQKIIQKKKRTPEQWADYFLEPEDKEFWGNLHFAVFTGSPEAFHILYLAECLGIHLHFMPFGTEKVESCSTSLLEEHVQNTVWADSSIIINTDVCDTTEKCLFAMAKEFFNMISRHDEYGILSVSDFQIESQQTRAEAEQFTRELLLPEKKLMAYIEKQKLKVITARDISRMKHQFAVGHEVLIERLNELNLCSISKQEYRAELERYYEDIGKVPSLNSEPEPLPISYRGGDFFECAILAAYRHEPQLLTARECAEYLGCTEDELEDKVKLNSAGINMILEDE